MEVREIWTDADFDVMGWHDSHIHGMTFPGNDMEMAFDIDYLFEWVLNKGGTFYSFWVSPCVLTFYQVRDLKMDLDFGLVMDLEILDIEREGPAFPSYSTKGVWNYSIITDKGVISFESLGYRQVVKKQPALLQEQYLARDKW